MHISYQITVCTNNSLRPSLWFELSFVQQPNCHLEMHICFLSPLRAQSHKFISTVKQPLAWGGEVEELPWLWVKCEVWQGLIWARERKSQPSDLHCYLAGVKCHLWIFHLSFHWCLHQSAISSWFRTTTLNMGGCCKLLCVPTAEEIEVYT